MSSHRGMPRTVTRYSIHLISHMPIHLPSLQKYTKLKGLRGENTKTQPFRKVQFYGKKKMHTMIKRCPLQKLSNVLCIEEHSREHREMFERKKLTEREEGFDTSVET